MSSKNQQKQPLDKKIDSLKQALAANQFEPYIRHIRFPHFKNLSPGLSLSFDFPITALVGPNGSNKSSILRAIAACPHYENLGDYWFSTDIDPIDEKGGRPRYIFGYFNPPTKSIVEVIQTRIKKEKDPDYWEPSRPIIKDGMTPMPDIDKSLSGTNLKEELSRLGRKKTRWSGIEKNVLLIDFRNEISAFDKALYHGDASSHSTRKKGKEFLRDRSKHLKKVIQENLSSYKPFKGKEEKILLRVELTQEEVDQISLILGREYKKISLIKHTLFDSEGFTAIMSTNHLDYSEAFAGSGEFAVVMLVYKLNQAPAKSLIILDEPEVSLHPGAQVKLSEFLISVCLANKHQIFIGTHSKFIIEALPAEAITLLQQNQITGKMVAQQKVKASEAFFHLGHLAPNKTKVFVEDRLAEELVKRCLRTMGPGAFDQFEIIAFPGGAQTILGKCIPTLVQTNDNNSLIFLDGDQKPANAPRMANSIPATDTESITKEIKNITGIDQIKFALHSGTKEEKKLQQEKLERSYLEFCNNNLYYLPANTPEEFIWNALELDKESKYNSSPSHKDKFANLTRDELAKMDNEQTTSDEILSLQVQYLAKITESNEDIQGICEILKKYHN